MWQGTLTGCLLHVPTRLKLARSQGPHSHQGARGQGGCGRLNRGTGKVAPKLQGTEGQMQALSLGVVGPETSPLRALSPETVAAPQPGVATGLPQLWIPSGSPPGPPYPCPVSPRPQPSPTNSSPDSGPPTRPERMKDALVSECGEDGLMGGALPAGSTQPCGLTSPPPRTPAGLWPRYREQWPPPGPLTPLALPSERRLPFASAQTGPPRAHPAPSTATPCPPCTQHHRHSRFFELGTRLSMAPH